MGILTGRSKPTNDRRRFHLDRTFVFLGSLFALFLMAAGSLAAQSGSSAPPATQSEEQSAPPCSKAPPIMKRGSEPEPPPCPDAAPDDSPDSPPPSAPLIEKARYVAFQFAQKLPNFVCEEYMARYRQRGSDKVLIDIVSAEVVFNNGKETYRNVKVNSRATDKAMMELGGASSTGEFASILLDLFSTPTDAQFRPGGSSPIAGFNAQVYDFHVQRENSHWNVEAESQSLRPAYQGSVWIDPASARVLRIEMQAGKLPSGFPMSSVETAVDYSSVRIGENSSLLPVHAETLGCDRGSADCSHNIIDFRNYHEFKVDFKIGGVAN